MSNSTENYVFGELKAMFVESPELNLPLAWRVCCETPCGRRASLQGIDGGDLRFARQRDAELAALALRDAGIITREDVRKTSHRKVVEIALSGLQW